MSVEREVTIETVLDAARAIREPVPGAEWVAHELLRNIKICGGNVAFDLFVGRTHPELRERVEHAFRDAVAQVPGVTSVAVRARTEPTAPPPQPAAPTPGSAQAASPARPAVGGPGGGGVLPGVKTIIAVGSGKGGVGKSTVAVNLAVALAQEGYRVGLLDADVYGPSIPMMMGIRDMPHTAGGRLIPLERHGVKLMSLGFLMTDDSQHVIWRGPMVGGAVKQMLADSNWGELDFLLVDLPPGTGDAQLTLAQTVPVTGAVVVMTSQNVAVSIASKAIGMFRAVHVPILGVVGNMDTFACPHCGEHSPVFTHGGSEAAAARLQVPFLGSIPLDPATVEHGDSGTPTVLAAPASAQAEAFRNVARNVVAQLNAEAPAPAKDPLGGLGKRFGHSS